jgi:hypothetical protein
LIPGRRSPACGKKRTPWRARARALERIAQERAEKVLKQLRGAVSEEMVLPVDMSKGVAGALLSRAAGLKRLAVQVSRMLTGSSAPITLCRRQVMQGDRRGHERYQTLLEEVRSLEASLPEFVWLVDVEGSGPVEVGARLAAQLLIAKSHRVASEEELSVQRQAETGARQGAAAGSTAA